MESQCAGNFAIAHSIDSSLKTPYSYTFDFSVARELKGGFSIEASYVGRLGHRLLTQMDSAIPLDLKDKASWLDYFTALTALAKIYRTGEPTQNFNASQVPRSRNTGQMSFRLSNRVMLMQSPPA